MAPPPVPLKRTETAFPAYQRLPEGRQDLPSTGDALRELKAADLRPQFNPIHVPMGWPKFASRGPAQPCPCTPPSLDAARLALAGARATGLEGAARLTDDHHEVGELQRILMQNGAGSQVVAGVSTHHVQADSNNWMVREGHTTGSGYRGSASVAENLHGTNLGGFVDPYVAGASVSGVLATPGSDILRGNAVLFGCPTMVGAAGNFSWTAASGAMLGVGVAEFVVGLSGLSVLPPLPSTPPGHQRVQFMRKVVPGVGFDLYGGAHTFALGGRLMLSRARLAQGEITLPDTELRALLRGRDTRLPGLRDLAQGLGLRAPSIDLPKRLRAIETGGDVTLEVGDCITLQVTGAMCLGFSVGAYGVRGGIYGFFQGESALTLRRLDAHTVEVAHAPKKERGVSLNLDVMIVAEAFYTRSVAQASLVSHRFDLRHAEARDALRASLRGEAPFVSEAAEAPALPRGVTLGVVETASRPLTLMGVRVPKPFFLKNWAPLGANRGHFSGQAALKLGQAGLSYQVVGSHVSQERGPAGARTTAQTTHVLRLHAFNAAGQEQSRLEGVETTLVLRHEHLSLAGMQRTRSDWRTIFGHALPPFQRSRAGETYTVRVTRTFEAAELKGLDFISHAALNLVCTDHPDLAEQLRRVPQHMTVLGQLTGHQRRDKLAQGRADLLQQYLADDPQGRRMAAVHFLLGDDLASLRVTTESSQVNDALARARRLQATWDAEPPRRGSRDARRAQAQLSKAERRLGKAMKATNDDQILRHYDPSALLARLDTLGKAQAEMRSLWEQLLKDA